MACLFLTNKHNLQETLRCFRQNFGTISSISRDYIKILLVLQLIFQFLTVSSCDFLQVQENTANSDVESTFNADASGQYSLGLWTYGVDGECNENSYSHGDDGMIRGARNSLTFSMICGGAALILITFEWLFCEVCCAGCLEGLAFAIAWILGW